jgi:hypothetical protein
VININRNGTNWYDWHGWYGSGSFGNHNAMSVFLSNIDRIRAQDLLEPGFFAAALLDAWTTDDHPNYYLYDFLTLEQLGILEGIDSYLPKPPPLPKGRKTYTVFRGVGFDEEWRGMSWTLDRTVAEFFAYKCIRTQRKSSACVLTSRVRPNQVMGYSDERKEKEVVLWPSVACRMNAKTL